MTDPGRNADSVTAPAAENKAVTIEDTLDLKPSFKRGDRVLITNLPSRKALGLGFSRATTEQDRNAFVTEVVGERIHVLTDNNEKKWRLAKNLLHL